MRPYGSLVSGYPGAHMLLFTGSPLVNLKYNRKKTVHIVSIDVSTVMKVFLLSCILFCWKDLTQIHLLSVRLIYWYTLVLCAPMHILESMHVHTIVWTHLRVWYLDNVRQLLIIKMSIMVQSLLISVKPNPSLIAMTHIFRIFSGQMHVIRSKVLYSLRDICY